MKYLLITVLSLAAVATLAVIVGCDDDHHSMMSDNDDASAVTIASFSPADGSTDVSPGTPVSVTFTGAVDTSSVRRHFHLAGGPEMHVWRDSLSHHGGFGHMNMNRMGDMLRWIDSIHVGGEFHWNADLDSCEFIPQAGMDYDTDYMCLLAEDSMRTRGGHMMGGSGHHNNRDNGFHMYEFRTTGQ